MTRGARRARSPAAPLPALALTALLSVVPAGPAAAQPAPDHQAFLFLVDRASFEEVLAVPEFAALARAGGAGLCNFLVAGHDVSLEPYVMLGAGARAAAPFRRVAPAAEQVSEVDVAALLEENDRAIPGLLGEALADAGLSVGLLGNADDRVGVNAPGMLAAMDERGRIPDARVAGLTVPAADRLGGLRTDEDAMLDEAAEMVRSLNYLVVDLGDTLRIDGEAAYAETGAAAPQRDRALADAGRLVRGIVESSPADEALVMVVTPVPSTDMRAVHDVVTPVILARGSPADLFPGDGGLHGLVSDSTRFDGIVTGDDVAPTVLEFLGQDVPAEMTGSAIRATEGGAPFGLHVRHLEHRRARIPMALGVAVPAVAIVALSLWRVRARGAAPATFDRALAFLMTAVAAIPAVLLVPGYLPHLTYAWAVPAALAACLGLGALGWGFRHRDPAAPVMVVAAAVAALVVVDTLLGGPAQAASFGGVTAFEGRSYGLRNIYVGPLIAGAVLVAARLTPRRALVLVLAAAALAGSPGVGSEVGGCATLLVVAPLLAHRLAGRPIGPRAIGWAIVSLVVGLALLFAADAILNTAPTHAGRFAERVGSTGPGAFLAVARDRLAATVDTIGLVPPAWLLVGWYVAVAFLAPRVRGRVGAGFDRAPGHRAAVWTLGVAALLAIAFNDTGISTAVGLAGASFAAWLVPGLLTASPPPDSAPAPSAALAGSRA